MKHDSRYEALPAIEKYRRELMKERLSATGIMIGIPLLMGFSGPRPQLS